jgi:hypothetical protein
MMGATDVRDGARHEGGYLQGSQDPSVMQKVVIIAGGALAVIVLIRLGFMGRVQP